MMLDDMREVFSIALITLGYSINDTNPEHLKQVYLKLKQLMPNIKMFNSDAVQNILIDEDAYIGMEWNGETYIARQENPNLVYIYPQDGFPIWIDSLAIVKNAPHLNNAYKFINFLIRPDIAKKIALYSGYSSPNLAAVKMLPKNMQNNPVINPYQKTLQKGQLQLDLGAAANKLYIKYWELLKIGG